MQTILIYLKLKFVYFVFSEDSEQIVYPADVVLFEGILLFYFPEIRDLFHMKLFVDTDSDTRLSRRGMHYIVLLSQNCYRLV